jgi:hypothetical protein
MISLRLGYELTLLVVLGIVTLFLFPAMQGPYSAVHGPATALQAARAAARLRTAIVQGASNCLQHSPISQLVVFSWMSLSAAEFRLSDLPEYTIVLRC